jgi:hypothetical protein
MFKVNEERSRIRRWIRSWIRIRYSEVRIGICTEMSRIPNTGCGSRYKIRKKPIPDPVVKKGKCIILLFFRSEMLDLITGTTSTKTSEV